MHNEQSTVADIYQTPLADLQRDQDRVAGLYVVSRFKFIVLYVATLGLYGVYWFYKHWSLHKSSQKLRIWPVARTIFSIFFAHSLFRLIYRKALEINQNRRWRPDVYATIYVIFDLIGTFNGSSLMPGISETTVILLALLSILVVGRVLYEAQIYANIACLDATGKSNSRITMANYFWIILSLFFWALSLFGILLEAGVIDIG